MSIYLDSSFVVSLYLTDIHSAEARQRARAALPFALTPLHLVEWAHAIAQHEFRGNLAPEQARQMQAKFISDQKSGLWSEISLPENAFAVCVDLAHHYGAKLGVRALDSLHVACALELKAARFWTFDERQAKLARVEGLRSS